MEIVKRGEKPKAWPRLFDCPECSSTLKLELSDISKNTDWQGGFSSYFIDCPVCHEQPDVPQDWWRVISRDRRRAF